MHYSLYTKPHYTLTMWAPATELCRLWPCVDLIVGVYSMPPCTQGLDNEHSNSTLANIYSFHSSSLGRRVWPARLSLCIMGLPHLNCTVVCSEAMKPHYRCIIVAGRQCTWLCGPGACYWIILTLANYWCPIYHSHSCDVKSRKSYYTGYCVLHTHSNALLLLKHFIGQNIT